MACSFREYLHATFFSPPGHSCSQGYKKRNAYIAAQAPLENTVGDFWRMIWEFKSKCIVMLCNLQERGKVYIISGMVYNMVTFVTEQHSILSAVDVSCSDFCYFS